MAEGDVRRLVFLDASRPLLELLSAFSVRGRSVKGSNRGLLVYLTAGVAGRPVFSDASRSVVEILYWF